MVTRDSLIGLVYVRHGDSTGATRVAKSHTRLLRARVLMRPVRYDPRTGRSSATPVQGKSPWHRTRNRVQPRASSDNRDGNACCDGFPQKQDASTERTREIHNLETAVEDYINRLRKEGKLDPDERTGWSVYDFTTGEKLVTINEDEQFQTASLVKPFIAAAYFYKVERGKLSYNRESRRQLERMIQHSNNTSANWVTRRVGGPGG